MAQLMGAESMHYTRSSLYRKRPGYAVRASPTSGLGSEVTCIVCGNIADSSALKCLHHYCGRCYVKLYVPDRGTFVCKADHCDSRDKSSEAWITPFSSGYHTGSPPLSAYQSRNSNFSQRSKAVLSAFLKMVLCLDAGDKDEDELDADAVVPLRVNETLRSGKGVDSIELDPIVSEYSGPTLTRFHVSSVDGDFARRAVGRSASVSGQGQYYDMACTTTTFGPNLRDKTIHNDERMEIVENVGRPARPLEPEIVIHDNPRVHVLGESDSESELGAVGGALNERDRDQSNGNDPRHQYHIISTSHLRNIPEVGIHKEPQPIDRIEFIRHVGARPMAPPDHLEDDLGVSDLGAVEEPDQGHENPQARSDRGAAEQIVAGEFARRPQYPYRLPYEIISQVNLHGSSTSQFSGPNSVKFDKTNSAIIIVDTQNHRLKVYLENMSFSHCFGGSAPCPNGGQFCRPLSCVPYLGRVIVAEMGHNLSEGRVQVVKIDGEYVRRIGQGKIVQPTCLSVEGRVLVVVDCNRLKLFRLSEEDTGHDEYIGEVYIHVHGDIQCICQPDERTVIVADEEVLHIIVDNLEIDIINLDGGGLPRCMRTDSQGFLLILYADRVDVYTPAPECHFYCTFLIRGINIDVYSMDVLPDSRLIMCGWHGYVELKFMPWPTSPVMQPHENLESSL